MKDWLLKIKDLLSLIYQGNRLIKKISYQK